jgi:hypothetical protein
MNVTIKDLYNETATIQVKFAEYPQPFDVEMINEASRYGDKLKQDCKVGSWGANRFFRTAKGEWNNDNRYKSVGGLKRGIIAAAKERNLTVENFILTAN